MKGRVLGLAGLVALAGCGRADPGGHSHPPGTTAHDDPPGPVRISAEELHRQGGVPKGWRFRLPAGDAGRGREVFVKLECYTCHAVRGESFPAGTPVGAGPELSGMGGHHPAEYFAESVLDPNAVILTGPGYSGPDGGSTMPDYSESVSIRELLDLVAYLRALK